MKRTLILASAAAAFLGALILPAPSPRALAEDEPENDVRERPQYVNERTERAIERGCAWLAKHQKPRSGELLSDQSGYGSGYPVAMTRTATSPRLATSSRLIMPHPRLAASQAALPRPARAAAVAPAPAVSRPSRRRS